jgi:CRP/FNR family transcriptional regulator, anaerobic regulatory protein
MLTVENINFIKNNIPFYAQLNMVHQEQLIQSTTHRALSRGEQFFTQNDDCSGLVVVESGRIRAYIMSADGKEVTLFRLLDKDICLLSATCVFHNLNFTVYFEVEQDSSIFVIPAGVFEEISRYNIHVKGYMLEQMTSRFSSAMSVMEQVVFGTLSKRVAGFIFEQMVLENSQTLSISHDAIAKNIGSAREVVSRMLKQMKNDQIIQMSRGTIYVNNPEKLKSLTE